MKAGLLELVAHAHREAGWSLRRSAALLGIEHTRLLRWTGRAMDGRLDDVRPRPDSAVHALLDWERTAILDLAEAWGEVDRSHRKLADRGSRLDLVHVSESTCWRVLLAAGVILPAPAQRVPRAKSPWPQWAELVPGKIWIYDFTHFRASRRCAIAIVDVVSRLWLATVVSAQESSTQVEVAFTAALVADGKAHLLDEPLLAELAAGVVPDNDDRVPVLLAVSDNGPQMTSNATAVFMAGARIAQHFGRPATPNDQAWIESFFGHLKGEHPHLDKITDPGELDAELGRCRTFYNTVRLHESLGYVTPDDEHHGRGPALRAARRAGLDAAHQQRLATNRQARKDPS
ncbi:MAG TPA: integrase core domain-containing protein [Mycobacteriales bacterium]|nr:integrase core domain-containing protein [Mycobacteriales bacterium]